MPLLNLAQSWTESWAQRAQQHARRNAMIALTECTQRRAEREDVERFLAERQAPPATPQEPTVSLHA